MGGSFEDSGTTEYNKNNGGIIMRKRSKFFAIAGLTACFALSLTSAFAMRSLSVSVADETTETVETTEVAQYYATFNEMAQYSETNNRYTTLVYYQPASYGALGSTYIDGSGASYSRYLKDTSGVGKRYNATLVWTAPSDGTMTATNNAKVDLIPLASTRITVFKGTIVNKTSASDLIVLYDGSFEEKPSDKVSFYNYIKGVEVKAGESIIVTARAMDTTADTTAVGWANYGIRFEHTAATTTTATSYAFNALQNSTDIFSVSAWKESNPTYSFYAMSDIKEITYNTVSFVDSNGNTVEESQKVQTGSTVTLPTSAVGWYADSTFYRGGAEYVVSEDIALVSANAVLSDRVSAFAKNVALVENDALNCSYGETAQYGNWSCVAVSDNPLKGDGNRTVFSTNNRSRITPQSAFGYYAVLAYRASEDGTLVVGSLSLDNGVASGGKGVHYAVLYKTADGQYYNAYGDETWHFLEADGSVTALDIPSLTMSEGDEILIVVKDTYGSGGNYSATNLDLIMTLVTDDKAIEAKMVQTSGVHSTQGQNGFYFRYAEEQSIGKDITFNDREGNNLSTLSTNLVTGDTLTLPSYKNLTIVRHRGAELDSPENTEPAFRLAAKQGSKTVETDVCFTKDGVPVLLHDATIDRTSDGEGNVADMTLEELQKLDFGSWKSTDYAGTKILTLAEFFDLLKELDLNAYVEIKIDFEFTDEYAKTITDLALEKEVTDRVTWISFSATNLGKIGAVLTSARLGVISNEISEDIVARATNLKTAYNEVFIDVKYTGVDSEGIARAKDAGFAVEVWTVSTKADMYALDEYVSGVTTNYYYPDKAENCVFIGWMTSDGKLYAANKEYTVTDDVSFTAAFIEFSMDDGVFFKIGQDETQSGVAFRSRVKLGAYESFVTGFGTIILPTDTLGELDFTLANFTAGVNVVQVASTKSVTENGETVWLGGLGTLKSSNFTRDFSGRGYLEVTYSDGTVGYIYTEYSDKLNSNNVADMAEQYKSTCQSDYESLIEASKNIVDAYIEAKNRR